MLQYVGKAAGGRHHLSTMARIVRTVPYSSLSMKDKALASVPGGHPWFTSSRVYENGEVIVEAKVQGGRRIMTAKPKGKNRFVVKVESYPRINRETTQVTSTVVFTAGVKWVEGWKELAHERALSRN